MVTFKNLPIKKKLRYAMLLTAYSVLLVTLGVQTVSEYFHSRSLLVNKLETLVEVIGANAQAALIFEDTVSAEQLLNGFSNTAEIETVYLLSSTGERVAAYHQGKKQPWAFTLEELNQPVTLFSKAKLHLYRPINMDGQFIGAIYVQSNFSELYRHLTQILFLVLIAALISVVLAAILSSRLQQLLARPITELADTISEITEYQQYDRHVQKFDNDEIGQLYDCFNEMLMQIKERDDRLRQNRETLEATVANRTRELKMANRDLKENVTQINEAKEAALDAAKTKSAFLANMSHEIRTPMNGVLGMLDLMKDTTLSKTQSDFLNTAYASADSLLQIINDILDFSKIEAGKMTIEHIEVSIRDIVEDVCTLLAGSAREKGLELSCYTDVDLPGTLKGDPVRLRQILTNLIGNAVKFTAEGEVSVKVNLIERSRTTAQIEFSVEDTGIGIAENILPTLFNEFTQADGSTTRKFGGTGLGLTISRQLVELMGGQITVVSTRELGSTFTVVLEMEISKNQHIPKSQILHSLDGIKTLVVDDNKTNREILHHYLTAWGLNHSEVTTAKDALEQLRDAARINQPFELVFLDMDMPDMDGLELSKIIEKDSGLKSTRRIMLSSTGFIAQSLQRAAGISACLSKPFRQDRLLDTTMQVMHSHHSNLQQNGNTELKSEASVFSESIRILLVEDNIVNQKVAISMLKKIGLNSIDLAEDGQQAVTIYDSQTYDLILMDCQMPVMSGYEATGLIRQREREQQLPRIPIIAMTANAMTEDRDKCIAAGMDDYLSKPVKVVNLKNRLKHWLINDNPLHKNAETGSIEASPKLSPQENQQPLIDQSVFSTLKEIMEEDFPALINSYIEDAPKLMADIKSSSKDANLEVLIRAAHTLKSSSNNFGAIRLATIAADIEKEGQANKLNEASALIPTLKSALDETIKALKGSES
ncbi:response regulator [Endozoicomonas sp.]|uniref:response regulator n=1 Tax=Endozoicomonas sp. TaxID=1892382 RepID=UPI0028838142|nr:response regulator [Endozoicomonas sp.]